MIKEVQVFWFILIFNIISCVSIKGQEVNTDIELINTFLDKLIDQKTPSTKIVEDYLFLKPISRDSIVKKTRDLANFIEMARNDLTKDEKDGWTIVNPEVAKIRLREIHEYEKYRTLDEVDLNVSKNELQNTYVLLSPKKNRILQYFWVKDKKIYSFNLFIQNNTAWFFTYN